MSESIYVPTMAEMMAKGEQRVQMSCRDFCNRVAALVRVDIY